MMAIPNLADWFAPTTAPSPEATAEAEAMAQNEFAALLAASYTAPPAPAAPTVVVANTAESLSRSEAVTATTEFVLPTVLRTPIAAQPITTGSKTTEATLTPTTTKSNPAEETMMSFTTASNGIGDTATPITTGAKVAEDVPKPMTTERNATEDRHNPSFGLTPERLSQETSAPNRTAQTAGETQLMFSAVQTDATTLPATVTQTEAMLSPTVDVRIPAPAVLPANAASNPVVAPRHVVQSGPVHIDRAVASEPLPTGERRPPVTPTISPGTPNVLKLAVAAVKTLVTESRAELSPPVVATSVSKPNVAVQDAPMVLEPDAMVTRPSEGFVSRAEAVPAETALPAVPTLIRAGAAPAEIRRRDGNVPTTKRRDTMSAVRLEINPPAIVIEPVAAQFELRQSPKAAAVPVSTELTEVRVTTKSVQITSEQSPEQTLTPEFTPPPSRSVQAQTGTPTQFVPAPPTPIRQPEFTHIASLALSPEPTAVAVATFFPVEESGAATPIETTPETTLQTTLQTTPQPSVHQAVSASTFAAVTTGSEAEPLVKQTIPPVLELAQRLDAPATRSLRLQLNPAELGRVEVEVTRDAEGQISAVLKVEQAETARTLTHSLGQLRESLERAGVVVEQLHVTHTPPLQAQTSQQFGQQFGQQSQPQHTPPTHFTNADSLPAESSSTEGTASAADQKLLSMLA